MKVAYITAQQKEEGFDSSIPISYVAIQIQDFEPPETQTDIDLSRHLLPKPEESAIFYEEDDMDDFFDLLIECNLVVLFNKEFTCNVLNKYWTGRMQDDFAIFDLQELISDVCKIRVSINMLGVSVSKHRMVANGLAYVTFYKNLDFHLLIKCMERDIDILRSVFKAIMSKKLYLKISIPRRDKDIHAPIAHLSLEAYKLSRKSFWSRCSNTLRYLNDDKDGIEREYFPKGSSQADYLIAKRLCYEKDGVIYIGLED